MAILGIGTELGSEVINNIGEIRSISFSLSSNSLDATQTTSPYTQSVPSGMSGGAISISFLYDGNSGQEADDFIKEMDQRRITFWQIDLPDGRFTSYGYISSISITSSYDSLVTMDATITLTGKPTFNGN